VSRPPDFLLDTTFFDNSARKVKPLSESEKTSTMILPDVTNNVGGDLDTEIIVSPNVQNEDLLRIKNRVSNTDSNPANNSNTDDAILVSKIEESNNKLFFVRFTPANTLRPRWFLVQIEQQNSDETPLPFGVYFCTFLQKHPSDKHKSDDKSRWWPEWRELLWDKDNNYDFGDRILFSPSQKPDLSLFGKFGTEINLFDNETNLVGPFNFLERNPSSPGQSLISEKYWMQLASECAVHSLTPPILSSSARVNIACASSFHSLTQDSIVYQSVPTFSSLTSMKYLFVKKRGTLRSSRNARKTVARIDQISTKVL
jgi:hypothetical protein